MDFRWVATDAKLDLLSPEGDFPRLTYWPQNWRSLSACGLFGLAWSTLGNSLVYMDFLHGEMPDAWYGQRDRIHEFCRRLAREGHDRRFPDTAENRAWLQALLVEIGDEVENQC